MPRGKSGARNAPTPAGPIILPHNYTPRAYQIPALRAHELGAKRLVCVDHRRAGKDKTWWNRTIQCAFHRKGTYFYTFPTYAQAEKVIWRGMDRDGFRYIDHAPAPLVARKNDTNLRLDLCNGSTVQLIGTDNVDAVLGTNPIGVVFSEYSLQDPRAWDLLRPILLENGGWASFIYTPRGKNHGYDMYNLACKMVEDGNPDWYVERLTVSDTNVITSRDIDEERASGMDEELVQQEYFCSFEGASSGSYYGRLLNDAEAEKRVTNVPVLPDVRVDTWWDLGVRDATAVWFTQNVGRAVHVVDYYEESGVGLETFARVLDTRGYLYGTHNAPHDIKVREIGSDAKSRIELARGLGINFSIVDDIPRQDGINAVRSLLPVCYFDRTRTERGRVALMSYHKHWDDARKTYSDAPYHDWSSNAADAFRYLAVGHRFDTPLASRREYTEVRDLSPARGYSSDGGWMAW